LQQHDIRGKVHIGMVPASPPPVENNQKPFEPKVDMIRVIDNNFSLDDTTT